MSHRKKHIKKKIHSIKPKKNILKRPVFWYSLLLAVVILGSLYFLLFFQDVWVKNINVSGNRQVSSEKIKNIVASCASKNIALNIKSKSILLADLNFIDKSIQNQCPEIKSAIAEKKYPDTVNIRVVERKPVAVFCQQSNEKCFYMDEEGVIFEELQNVPKDMVIVRQGNGSDQALLGKSSVSQNVASLVLKVQKDLKDNFQINAIEAQVLQPDRLDIKTGEGWQIYFDLNSDVNLQTAKLDLLLKNEISQDAIKKLQYIDLRFKDRAYYK